MHVLLIPAWYPTKDNEVRGSFFAEQAAALARAGHRVTVLPFYRDAKGKCYVEKTEPMENLTQYSIHYRNFRFHLTPAVITAMMAGVIRRELRAQRPDIIHVHSFRAAKYARALRRIFGIPYVITEHATWFERDKLSEKDLREASRGFNAADAVYTVSPGLKKVITPLCHKPITVIPNLVSERFFTGGLRAEPGESFGFLSVGTLEYKKGQDVLIKAFARVAKEEPRVTLTICGEGPYMDMLREKSAEYGIAERVTLTGRVSREEIARRMRENQAFVLPSRTETFGVVFIEAMACGLPIVMTKTNAWEMLALPETGIAVEIDDEDALTKAMLSIMRRYGEYDPETIAESCRSRFSEPVIAARLAEEYRRVLSEKQGKKA